MQTILIFRLGSLGDTVIALPCFHQIARSFPNARRIVLTNTPVAKNAAPLFEILGESGLVHDVITYPISLRDVGALRSLAKSIRASGATTLVHLTARRSLTTVLRDMIFFYANGIRRIIGAPVRADVRHWREESGIAERESERLTRQISELGSIDLWNKENWDIRLQPSEVARATEVISPLRGAPFFAVHAGSKVPINFWHDENWSQLLSRLTQLYPQFGLVMVGVQNERDRCDALAASWKGPFLNLCGLLSARQSAAVLQRATLFIGHDSGPMHLAASVQTRCVALFGNNNPPKRWHPIGASHRVFHDMRGVNFIRPEDVVAAVSEMEPPR